MFRRNLAIILVLLALSSACSFTPSSPTATRTSPELIETLLLDASYRENFTQSAFEAGQLYSIVIKGTADYSLGGGSKFDAQRSYRPQQQQWENAQNVLIYGQPATAALSDPENHAYLFYCVAPGRMGERRAMTLGINDSYYADNSGRLEVRIYRGFLSTVR
jgi:hypothetical protein